MFWRPLGVCPDNFVVAQTSESANVQGFILFCRLCGTLIGTIRLT